MSSLHCCRMTYLMNQFGMVVFDALYARFNNINVIQLILSFIPDDSVAAHHRMLMHQMHNSIIVYVYHLNIFRWQWFLTNVDTAACMISDRFAIPHSVAKRLIRTVNMVVLDVRDVTFDNMIIRRLA